MEDLATAFVAYVDALRDASPLADLDSTSLVAADYAVVHAVEVRDMNTAYAKHLSV